jgi:hypothetical protein
LTPSPKTSLSLAIPAKLVTIEDNVWVRRHAIMDFGDQVVCVSRRDLLNSLIIAGTHPARLGLVYEPVRLLAPRGNGLREAQRQ